MQESYHQYTQSLETAGVGAKCNPFDKDNSSYSAIVAHTNFNANVEEEESFAFTEISNIMVNVEPPKRHTAGPKEHLASIKPCK